jgi:hypothetical protein
MVEEARETGFSRERQPLPSSARAFFAAEGDGPIFERFEAVVGQGNPGDRGGEVGEDLRAGPGGLAGGAPRLVPDLGRDERVKPRRGQRRFARAPEEPGEGVDRQEPGRRARREPLQALGGQGAARDERMDMRMGGHVPGPGVEAADHTDLPAERVGVQRAGLESSRSGLQEQGGAQRLVRADDRAPFLRQRQGDQKVRDGQEEGALLVEPAGGRGVWARGAMAVLPRMRAILEFPTVGALGEMPASRLGAALLESFHRRQVAGEPTVGALRPVRRAIALDHRRQLDHG